MDVKQAEKAKTGIDTGYACPYCGKKEHIPNAVTLAAMQETLDMESGKIPTKWYHSLEEAIEDLHNS
jgi:hypothetical protein